jgi:hypothetical protein
MIRGRPYEVVGLCLLLSLMLVCSSQAVGNGTRTRTASDTRSVLTVTLSRSPSATKVATPSREQTRSSSITLSPSLTRTLPSQTRQVYTRTVTRPLTATPAIPTPAPPSAAPTVTRSYAPATRPPPFEPDLGDLSGPGAVLVLGLVLGLLVMVFGLGFCCCMRGVATDSKRRRTAHSQSIELTTLGTGDDWQTPAPMPR